MGKSSTGESRGPRAPSERLPGGRGFETWGLTPMSGTRPVAPAGRRVVLKHTAHAPQYLPAASNINTGFDFVSCQALSSLYLPDTRRTGQRRYSFGQHRGFGLNSFLSQCIPQTRPFDTLAGRADGGAPCAVQKVGYFGPGFPNGQGDRSSYCVPIRGAAQIPTQSKNSDNEPKQSVFHTENARLLSKSAGFALWPCAPGGGWCSGWSQGCWRTVGRRTCAAQERPLTVLCIQALRSAHVPRVPPPPLCSCTHIRAGARTHTHRSPAGVWRAVAVRWRATPGVWRTECHTEEAALVRRGRSCALHPRHATSPVSAQQLCSAHTHTATTTALYSTRQRTWYRLYPPLPPPARATPLVRATAGVVSAAFGTVSYPLPPPCNSHALVQAIVGVGTVLIWGLI